MGAVVHNIQLAPIRTLQLGCIRSKLLLSPMQASRSRGHHALAHPTFSVVPLTCSVPKFGSLHAAWRPLHKSRRYTEQFSKAERSPGVDDAPAHHATCTWDDHAAIRSDWSHRCSGASWGGAPHAPTTRPLCVSVTVDGCFATKDRSRRKL